MKHTLLLLFVITTLLSGTFSTNAQEKPSTLFSRIDNYLTAGTNNGFSGAISVMKNGELIISKGYGMANKDTNTANNSNTIFDIGSNTKQFTAAAILKLAEQGKLSVTDPLSKFFKEVPEDKKNITIHQLLSHSAGFLDALDRDFTEISEADFFKELFASKLLSVPGETYAYSNTGYSVLGKIIELASGQEYETYLHEQLFKPAGMHQTGYLIPEWDNKQLSRSYNRGILENDAAIMRYQEDGNINWHLKANGGMYSTQKDMLLWYEALRTHKVLSKASIEKLTIPHITYESGSYTYAYAYGWTIRILENGMKRLAHNGSNGAYSHTIIWFPEEDIYIVYATNANSSKVEFIAYTVTKMLLDDSYVPEPIQNNIYAFIFNYTKQHTPNTSAALLTALKKDYSDDFTSSGILNVIGNLILRSGKNLDWAIELFKSNVTLYPEDGNLWDSLGDGYKANNQIEAAIKSYQKAIDLGYNDAQEKLAGLKNN